MTTPTSNQLNEGPLADLNISEEDVENAQNGVFKRTLLERWEFMLVRQIDATAAPTTIEIASNILTTYTFLKHRDLAVYRANRVNLLSEALVRFYDILLTHKGFSEEDKEAALERMFFDRGDQEPADVRPSKIAELYEEIEDDWKKHIELYTRIVAVWSALSSHWAEHWAANLEENPGDPAIPGEHASIIDTTSVLLNEQFGMVSALRDLQGFEIDEDTADKMTGYAAEYISEMSNE